MMHWYLISYDRGSFPATFVKGPFPGPLAIAEYLPTEIRMLNVPAPDLKYFAFEARAMTREEAAEMGEHGIESPYGGRRPEETKS